MLARSLALAGLLLVALFATISPAQEVTLPAEIRGEVGAFIKIKADTKDELVRWQSVDPGLNLFPVELLKDSKTAVVVAMREGRYRVFAVTAKGGIPSEFAPCVVIVGNVPPGPTPPGPTPPTPPTPTPPGPTPPPTPTPKVPDDRFGNVGQLAYRFAVALEPGSRSKCAATAKLFRQYAGELEDGTSPSIGVAGAKLKAAREILWGTDAPAWNAWAGEIAPAFDRNATSKQNVIDFYRCVAVGLEAAAPLSPVQGPR